MESECLTLRCSHDRHAGTLLHQLRLLLLLGMGAVAACTPSFTKPVVPMTTPQSNVVPSNERRSFEIDGLVRTSLYMGLTCLVSTFDGLSTGEPEPTMEVVNPATGAGFTLQTAPDAVESTEPPAQLLSSLSPLAPYTDAAVDQAHLLSRWNAFLSCSALDAHVMEWSEDIIVPESSVVLTYPASGRRFVVSAEGLAECGIAGVDWPWDGAVRDGLRDAKGVVVVDDEYWDVRRASQTSRYEYACGPVDSERLSIRLHTVFAHLEMMILQPVTDPGAPLNRWEFFVSEETALLLMPVTSESEIPWEDSFICAPLPSHIVQPLIALRRCAIEESAQPAPGGFQCGTGVPRPEWVALDAGGPAQPGLSGCDGIAGEVRQLMASHTVESFELGACWPPAPE